MAVMAHMFGAKGVSVNELQVDCDWYVNARDVIALMKAIL